MQSSLEVNYMDRPIEHKTKFRKKHLWLVAGGIFILLIAWYLIFSDKSAKLNVEKDKISIEKVFKGQFKNYISVTGTVEPITTIYLDAMEGGRVEEIIAEEGVMVKKGETLIKLRNTALILEISNYEALVSRTTNELRQARLMMEQQNLNLKSQILDLKYDILKRTRVYKNNQILFKQNHISREEFENSREQYELAKQKLELLKETQRQDSIYRNVQVNSLEKSVQRMQHNLILVNQRLESLNFKAPVSGELASLDLEVGQVLRKGQRIGQINILDSYKMRVAIDEYFISKVSRNLTGLCDFSGQLYKSVITKIYPEVTGGKFYADMVFVDRVPSSIKIGQTSRIRLELGTPKIVTLIPRGGFYQSTGGQWVFVVDSLEKTAIKRSITLGAQNPKFYEVLKGLEPGEKVVVSSYDNFGNAEKLILK